MVPVEQLSDRNFWHIYYIASEIKRELEITPDNQTYIRINVYIPHTANANPNYPYFYQNRQQALVYLESIGMILAHFHPESSTTIRITPSPQASFFSFCNKLAQIHNQRFVKPNDGRIKIEDLTDEQIEKLSKIIEVLAIALSMSHPPHIIYIPIIHFPQEIQQFDIIGLIYKLANDFKVLSFNGMVGTKPTEKELEIRFSTEGTMIKEFLELQKAIEARYLSIITKKEKLPIPTIPIKTEPLQVMLVQGSKISLEKNVDEAKYKLPIKLPAGTQWKNITMRFTDDDTLSILVQGKEQISNYKDMGFDGKGGKPSVLWSFLKVLSKYNGEISSLDASAKDVYKKQKQSLSEKLQSYFSLEADPFYPFQENKSYRVRFTLISPTESSLFKKKQPAKMLETPIKEDPFADLADFMNETAPVISQNETDRTDNR